MALELLQRGQQRPRLAVDEAEVSAAAAHLGLEADPRLGDAVGARRLRGRVPAVRPGVRQGAGEHVGDAVAPLHGPDVPRERDEVAPVALGGEQVGRGGGVTRLQGAVEALEPLLHLRGGGRTDGRGHRISPRYRWRPPLNTTPGPDGRGRPRCSPGRRDADAAGPVSRRRLTSLNLSSIVLTMPTASSPDSPRRSSLGLMVLWQLFEGPMHAYKMQKLFEATGKDRVVNVRSRASLYQTLERLERHGLVKVAETVRVEGYPDRVIYAITERRPGGRARVAAADAAHHRQRLSRVPGCAVGPVRAAAR